MDKQRDENTTEANIELNREFYGEDTQPTGWIKKSSPNDAENANMQMDRIFNEDDNEFDIQNSTSLRRSNG